MEPVQWTFENITVSEDSSPSELRHLADFLAKELFDLVINLPMRNGDTRRVSNFLTHGYRTRRFAVDYAVPLVTDVKCAKLLVEVSTIYVICTSAGKKIRYLVSFIIYFISMI